MRLKCDKNAEKRAKRNLKKDKKGFAKQIAQGKNRKRKLRRENLKGTKKIF